MLETGKSKGCAFVYFQDEEGAQNVLNEAYKVLGSEFLEDEEKLRHHDRGIAFYYTIMHRQSNIYDI
jgi:hypothetical protein